MMFGNLLDDMLEGNTGQWGQEEGGGVNQNVRYILSGSAHPK